MREEFAKLDRKVRDEAKIDPVCRRLMTVPGVGPIVSLTYTATIDIPARFRTSRAVGPQLPLRVDRNIQSKPCASSLRAFDPQMTTHLAGPATHIQQTSPFTR